MRGHAAFLLIALSLSPAALAGASAPIETSVSWHVALDASGSIVSMTPIDDGSRKALYAELEPLVRRWHFTAGRIDGKPAPAETTLTVQLDMIPVDRGYRVKLRGAGTGGTYASMTAPHYPDDAVSSGRSGAVLVDVHYDADGRVTSAQPIDGGEPKAGHAMKHAATVAVRHWTFTPERIAGRGVPGHALVPICFTANDGVRSPCHWHTGNSNTPIDADHPLALDSVVKLDTSSADVMH